MRSISGQKKCILTIYKELFPSDEQVNFNVFPTFSIFPWKHVNKSYCLQKGTSFGVEADLC